MNLSKLKPWSELKVNYQKEDEVSIRSVYYAIPNGGGLPYETNEIDIVVGADGHIGFYEAKDEGHAFFYPQQVKHLRKALGLLSKFKSKGEK